MQRVGLIAFPDFQVLSLSTLSVFECANVLANEPLHDLRILSEAGGPIRTSSGLTLETERFLAEAGLLDALASDRTSHLRTLTPEQLQREHNIRNW